MRRTRKLPCWFWYDGQVQEVEVGDLVWVMTPEDEGPARVTLVTTMEEGDAINCCMIPPRSRTYSHLGGAYWDNMWSTFVGWKRINWQHVERRLEMGRPHGLQPMPVGYRDDPNEPTIYEVLDGSRKPPRRRHHRKRR